MGVDQAMEDLNELFSWITDDWYEDGEDALELDEWFEREEDDSG